MGKIRVVEVVEVERKEKGGKTVSATFEALGVRFRCYRKRGGGISFFKSKPNAQVYDKNELRVPDWVFAEIYRQAAGILYPAKPAVPGRKNPRQKEEAKSKTFRRPVSNHTLPLPF